jgi:cytochrome c oxidase assembly factor CtaG
MTTWQLVTTAWNPEPSVLLGCGILLWGYVGALRGRLALGALWYVLGVMVLLLALVSPLDVLGDTYLFSAHMLQHLLLVLIVPPCLLLGMPGWWAVRVMRWTPLCRIARTLSRPFLAWMIGIGTLWMWHIPPLYNAALAHEALHITEHMSFLVTATIFWWPVLAPLEAWRAAPLTVVVYLAVAAGANALLGIGITFAPLGLYPAYVDPVDRLGLVPLLRHGWGLSPAVDQQLGGLLMWVPGGLVFLAAIVGTLGRWYCLPEEDVPQHG